MFPLCSIGVHRIGSETFAHVQSATKLRSSCRLLGSSDKKMSADERNEDLSELHRQLISPMPAVKYRRNIDVAAKFCPGRNLARSLD